MQPHSPPSIGTAGIQHQDQRDEGEQARRWARDRSQTGAAGAPAPQGQLLEQVGVLAPDTGVGMVCPPKIKYWKGDSSKGASEISNSNCSGSNRYFTGPRANKTNLQVHSSS